MCSLILHEKRNRLQRKKVSSINKSPFTFQTDVCVNLLAKNLTQHVKCKSILELIKCNQLWCSRVFYFSLSSTLVPESAKQTAQNMLININKPLLGARENYSKFKFTTVILCFVRGASIENRQITLMATAIEQSCFCNKTRKYGKWTNAFCTRSTTLRCKMEGRT